MNVESKDAMRFSTTETTQDGQKPLACGELVDFGALPLQDESLDESLTERDKALLAAKERLRAAGGFDPPYMILDLCEPQDIGLVVEGEPYVHSRAGKNVVEDDNVYVKLLMPASAICDITPLGSPPGGLSVVRCHAAVPCYRWFQAANLLLHYQDKLGRVMPFPLDQGDGQTVFHMLIINMSEHSEYQSLLHQCCMEKGTEEGFVVSAKFAYELLLRSGITKATHAQVDKIMTHVILMPNQQLRGVLILDAARSELQSETLKRFSIYY